MKEGIRSCNYFLEVFRLCVGDGVILWFVIAILFTTRA